MATKSSLSPLEQANALIAQLNKDFGDTAHTVIRRASEMPATQYLYTGNLAVDTQLLGGYGVPRGTITVGTGWEGSGKTQFGLGWIAAAQQQEPDKLTAVVAAERGDYTPEALRRAGVDPDRCLILDGGTAEALLNTLMGLFWDPAKNRPRNLLSLWVIDSIAALVPNAENAVTLDESTVRAPMAALMARFLRPASVKQGDAVGYIVNQLRPAMDAKEKPHQFGGKSLAYWPKIIWKFAPFGHKEPGQQWYDKQRIYSDICVRNEKCNIQTGYLGAQTRYRVYMRSHEGHQRGISHGETLGMLALQYGLIEKSGAWYRIPSLLDGDVKFNGVDALGLGIEQHGIYNPLRDLVYAEARRRTTANLDTSAQMYVDMDNGEILAEDEIAGRNVKPITEAEADVEAELELAAV